MDKQSLSVIARNATDKGMGFDSYRKFPKAYSFRRKQTLLGRKLPEEYKKSAEHITTMQSYIQNF